MMYVEFIKIFFTLIRANWLVLESFRPPEPKNVWFPLSRHDVRRVHKKFFSRWFARTDGCYSQYGLLNPKTFDSHFLDMMYVEFMKSFFSPIGANWYVLESFRPNESKNVWFPLCRHDVPRVEESFFSPIWANWWVLESFQRPEPKNVWFPLSRHDVRRVNKKFFRADSRKLIGVRVISASWA